MMRLSVEKAGGVGAVRRIFCRSVHHSAFLLLLLSVFLLLLYSCARMGNPDGGWYDETPPRVVGASPSDKATGVTGRKIYINFSEFIKIDNPTENVVISPPQLEAPEIKAQGKRIAIELKDSLKPNTTYTIDFSSAISDNNEQNPLGNYTYTFSTGAEIDTLEVSGTVLEAENLEPIKGILVGLYNDLSDSAFCKKPMLRVSKTDSRGHFVIKGVAPGKYHIYALQDADGNYFFNQKSEKLAFSQDIIVPSFISDVRQDTLWTDSLHIKNIERIGYTRFIPDDIVMRAFTEKLTDRYFLKSERNEADHFSLYFSYGDDRLPIIRGLNFDEKNAFLVESNALNDSITYWLRDTALVNKDSLLAQVQYRMTDDSTGVLINQTDTLLFLSKQTYAKRMKEREKAREEWQKKQDRAKKRGDKYETVMPPDELRPKIQLSSTLNPDRNIPFDFPTPLAVADTSKIHLYAKHDTLWYVSRFRFVERNDTSAAFLGNFPHENKRKYELLGEWRPGIEYSLEIDSAAFVDMYGRVSRKIKQGFSVKPTDEYASIMMNISGMQGKHLVVQLLNEQDKTVKEVHTDNGIAEFYYVDPKTYYMRLYVDSNNNGRWDTGDYAKMLQPEDTYYYTEPIECRAKQDITLSWNPTSTPLNRQKPGKITKQKPDKDKKIKSRNIQRAKDLGIKYLPSLM